MDNDVDDDDKGEVLPELSFDSTFKISAQTEASADPAWLELFLVSDVGKKAVI